jgi:hypothetical protein
MYRADGEGHVLGPDKAREYILGHYQTTAMFEVNEKGLKDAWAENRPIAHFAAALLQRISDLKLRKLRSVERGQWRSDIVAYLQHAAFFEEFLIGLKRRSPRLRFPTNDLVTRPASLGINAVAPTLALELPEETRSKTPTG